MPSQNELEIIIPEPDTTTAVGSSTDTSSGQVFTSYVKEHGYKTKVGSEEDEASVLKEVKSESMEMVQESRYERTLSQSSADHSGDGEYTAQYMGTLQAGEQGQNLLKQLATNLADLRKSSYMFVEEGDIVSDGPSDVVSKSIVSDDERNTMCREATNSGKYVHDNESQKGNKFTESGKVADDTREVRKVEKDSDNQKAEINPKQCYVKKKANSIRPIVDSPKVDEMSEVCEMKLKRINADTVKCLKYGSPVLVQEEENVTLTVKTEQGEGNGSSSSLETRKKKNLRKQREVSRGKVI